MTNWMGNKLMDDVQKTVKLHCANLHGNTCLLTDSVCLYHKPLDEGQQPWRCTWFEEAVLPNNAPVEFEYKHRLSHYLDDGTMNTDKRKCKRCDAEFIPTGINHQYCKDCRPVVTREATKRRQRRRREKLKGSM